MSIVICEHCDKMIDSDDDPECFCEPPHGMCTPAQHKALTTIVCESCRERAWDRQQERLSEDGAGLSLMEQQQAAYKIKRGLP